MFIAILAGANPILGRALSNLADSVGTVDGSTVGRVIVWSLLAAVAVVLVRPAFSSSRTWFDAVDGPDPNPPSAHDTARNTVFAMSAVFAGYLVLEVLHLVQLRDGASSIVVVQRSAHGGVFWSTVALALVTGVVCALFRGDTLSGSRANNTRRAAQLWIGLGLAIGIATYVRVGFHIERSGLSDQRILGVIGTTVVLVGMLFVSVRIRRGTSIPWLIRRQLDAALIALVLYALVPTHWLAAQVNVAVIQAGERAPLLHLRAQARELESLAPLIDLLDHPDPEVRVGIAALLEQQHQELGDELNSRTSIRQWNPIRGPVHRRLDAVQPRVAEILGDVPRPEARSILDQIAHRQTPRADSP